MHFSTPWHCPDGGMSEALLSLFPYFALVWLVQRCSDKKTANAYTPAFRR